MVSDRPAVDQNQTNQHLRIARLAVTAVSIGPDLRWPLALEIGRGQVVEHHVDLQREQVPQSEKKCVLDLRLALEQLIERAVPLLELTRLDPHPWRPAGLARKIVAPCGQPATAVAIADEVGLQPPRQAMFAARRGEPIGDQHQSAIAQRRRVATAGSGELVERRREPELVPHVAHHKHGSPIPRPDGMDILTSNATIGERLAVQQARQLDEVEMGGQQVLAAEIEDGAMTCLAVLAKGFDDTHVLVLDAFAAGGAHHPQEHGFLRNLSLRMTPDESNHCNCKSRIIGKNPVPTFCKIRVSTSAKSMTSCRSPRRICQTWARQTSANPGAEWLRAGCLSNAFCSAGGAPRRNGQRGRGAPPCQRTDGQSRSKWAAAARASKACSSSPTWFECCKYYERLNQGSQPELIAATSQCPVCLDRLPALVFHHLQDLACQITVGKTEPIQYCEVVGL